MAEYISFQPSDFFSPTIYTGNASTNAITGVGFQPDMTWIKNRTATGDHSLYDSPRGTTKSLVPNGNDEEQTYATGLTAFGADGFTVGAQAIVNGNTNDIASWNWKAGTTTGIAGSPSITPSSYSFNATSGFSIVRWSGTGVAGTLPHGLGVAPQWIIVKRLEGSNWTSGHEAAGWTKNWVFNEAEGLNTNTYWNDTNPTSDLFSVGTNIIVNASGSTYVGYLWAPVKGYSKFGSYIGNAAADGPFVYTGFRPAYVMIKRFTTGTGWYIWDNKREGYNGDNETLVSNTNTTGGAGTYLNLLSNGFKLLSNDGEWNNSSTEYAYMAFAEFPIVSSNDVPTIAG